MTAGPVRLLIEKSYGKVQCKYKALPREAAGLSMIA
jgi:hypothetical protein